MNLKLEWRHYKKVNKANKAAYLLTRDTAIFTYPDIRYLFSTCFVLVSPFDFRLFTFRPSLCHTHHRLKLFFLITRNEAYKLGNIRLFWNVLCSKNVKINQFVFIKTSIQSNACPFPNLNQNIGMDKSASSFKIFLI